MIFGMFLRFLIFVLNNYRLIILVKLFQQKKKKKEINGMFDGQNKIEKKIVFDKDMIWMT